MNYINDLEIRLAMRGLSSTAELRAFVVEYIDVALAQKEEQVTRLKDELAVTQERLARCQEGRY